MTPFPSIDMTMHSQVLSMHTFTSLLYMYVTTRLAKSTHQQVTYPTEKHPKNSKLKVSCFRKRPLFFLVSINRDVTFAPAKAMLIDLILQTATGSLMVHNLLGKLLGLNMGSSSCGSVSNRRIEQAICSPGYDYYY